MTRWRLRSQLDFLVEQLLQQLDGEVPVRQAAHFRQKLVRQNRDVRLLQASRGEDVHDLARARPPARRSAESRGRGPLAASCLERESLASAARTAWKNADIVADGKRGLGEALQGRTLSTVP